MISVRNSLAPMPGCIQTYNDQESRHAPFNNLRIPVERIAPDSGILRFMRATRQSAAIPERLIAVLWYLVTGLVALWLRIADLGDFVTVDEAAYWITRSHTFLGALRSGNFGATALSAHPGVTTMWLGAAGILLQGWLTATGLLPAVTFATALCLLRLPVVLIHTGCILAGFVLLRRLLPPPAALLAALLWATDPFLIAYSRVLHVDALAASFGALSLLAALYACQSPRRYALFIISGVCAGLAVLSKSPALALAPVVAALALWDAWRAPSTGQTKTFLQSLQAAMPLILTWGGSVAITIVALWPALWVDPAAVLNQVRFGVEVEGGQPHMLGNFFLGRPDPAPGALFYPVALALRSTPFTLIGLLVLPFVWHHLDPRRRRVLAILALAAIVFVVALSFFPKKFNRYLVPAFPFVDMLAAAGLWGMLNDALSRVKQRRPFHAQRTIHHVVLLLAGALAIANAWFWHPYAIAAYNQMLGGATAGAATFLTGWGEGNEQVAAWLATRPDIRGVITVAPNPGVIQPYMPSGAQVSRPNAGTLPRDAGYLVVDIRQVQDGEVPPPFDAFYQRVPPLFTVRIHGVTYAWVYQTPPAVEHPAGASFGDALALHGYDLIEPPERDQALILRFTLFAQAQPPPGVVLFAHLIGPDGRRVAQADVPLPVNDWTPGGYARQDVPLTLPGDAPAGNYRLFAGMYDAASGVRLPLSGVVHADPAVAGPEAVELLNFTLPE